MTSRIDRLRQTLAEHQLAGLLVSQPENRRYLSGFHGTAGYLLITAGEAILAVDFRYTEQAKRQAPGFRITEVSGPPEHWLPGLLESVPPGKLGFEATHMTVATHHRFEEAVNRARPDLSLVPCQELVERLRAVKEPEEVRLIEQAAGVADRAFQQVVSRLQEGVTEKEVAWELEKAMRQMGSQALPFDVIVASGPNAALPHARPGDRPLRRGEPVVIDMGARIDGYCSDMTRTIWLGGADEKLRQVYSVVLQAQATALAGIRAGLTGQQADAIGRQVIEEAGYGKHFGHSLGHGVGLAEHELPQVGPNADNTLADGMVLTVEPGIYLPGWGGVRIEDLAIIENGALRLLSAAPKMKAGG